MPLDSVDKIKRPTKRAREIYTGKESTQNHKHWGKHVSEVHSARLPFVVPHLNN